MATIGAFHQVGHEFHGEVITLSVQAKNVRIVPSQARRAPDGPTHRVLVESAEIGAGWLTSEAGATVQMSITLDDPSFIGPIVADLVGVDGGMLTLTWNRPKA